MSSPAHTVVLITGANTGIGYETVKALLASKTKKQPYTILLGSRSVEKGTEAITKLKSELGGDFGGSDVEVLQIDVSDDESINAAAETVRSKYGRVDVLINNAGASFDKAVAEGQMTKRQGWAASWDTNVAGTHIMTETFAPLLVSAEQKGTTYDPRVIFVTSGTSSLTESYDTKFAFNQAPAAGWPKQIRDIASYRVSKVGLNMLMRVWANLLKEDKVKVFAVAPGFLATGLGGEDLKKLGAGDPSLGGESLRKVVEGERDEDEGKVVRNYATPVQPW